MRHPADRTEVHPTTVEPVKECPWPKGQHTPQCDWREHVEQRNRDRRTG